MADHAQASIPETMTKGRIAHTSAAAAAGSWNQATDPSGVAFDATTVLDPAAPLTARLDPLARQHDPRDTGRPGHACIIALPPGCSTVPGLAVNRGLPPARTPPHKNSTPSDRTPIGDPHALQGKGFRRRGITRSPNTVRAQPPREMIT